MMKYRKRVPKALVKYINKKEIIKVVKSPEEASIIDTKISNALQIASSNLSETAKIALIEDELNGYAKAKEIDKPIRYFDAVALYLEQSKVSHGEDNNRTYFFNELLPNLLRYVFEKNPIVADITSAHLNQIALILQKLPSRNHFDLKRIDTYDFIVNAMNGHYEDKKKLHVETVNKQIKRIRSLALFGFRTGLFTLTTAITTVKHKYSAREERKALTNEEIDMIYDLAVNPELKDFINILRYTGMRVGEIAKYKMNIIDGIECFDLRDADTLKTMSSYRVIPKHPKIENIKLTYSLEYLSRQVKELIDKHLKDTSKKTTYSIRHTFASELIVLGVNTDIVAELLGHKHSGMTLSRYAKGFSVQQLYDAIVIL